jgi:hypothetical protein
VAEQRYKAVLAVIADGRTVTEVAKDWGVATRFGLNSGAVFRRTPSAPHETNNPMLLSHINQLWPSCAPGRPDLGFGLEYDPPNAPRSNETGLARRSDIDDPAPR